MKKHLFIQTLLVAIGLLVVGINPMWADSSVSGASIKYDVNGNSNQWWNVSSTAKQLNQVYTFKLKGFWAELGTQNVCENTCIYYGLTSACSLGNYNIKTPNSWVPSTKHFQTESMDVNILSGLTPNKYVLYAKFIGHGQKGSSSCGEISSSTYQMKFEYPAYLTGDGTWCGTEWNTTNDAQKMTYGTDYYTKTVSSVTQANHKLKVATYNWASSWGSAKYDAANSSNVYSESDASGNLQFQPAMAGDVTIKFKISDQTISIICAAPTITLDDEGGSGGDGSLNTYYGVAPTSVSVPEKDGYSFAGYWTGDDGTGTQVIGANGAWLRNVSNYTNNDATWKWIVRANSTLHAKWTQDPTLTLSGVSTTSLVSGESVTITVVRGNSSANITYQYKIGTGSWNNIATVSDQTYTYTPEANNGDTKIYYFRATMTDGSTYTTDASSAVKQYGKKTIKVKDSNGWGANFKIHRWGGDAGSTVYPGETANITSAGGQWKQIILYSSNTNFLLCKGTDTSTADNNKTSNQTYAGVTDGYCYVIGTTAGGSMSFTSGDCPDVPTVTTGNVTGTSSTSVTFPATVTSYGNDKTTYGVAYYQVNAEPTASTIYGSGTKAQISASVTADNTTASTSAKTITAGTNYWYVAYAYNGQSSSAVQYGSVKFLRTTAVTLDNQSATTAGATSVVAFGGRALPSIAASKPAKTGYTFGGYWTGAGGTGTKYYNTDGTSANNWPTNEGATKTLKAQWTANKYDVTLKLNGGTGTEDQVVQATYDAAMPTVLKTSGDAISIPTRTGYTLLGYWDNTSGGTQYYSYDGSSLSSSRSWNKTSATNLQARWQANQYTLTLYKNDGGDTYTTQTATYDATITITAPTRTGYTFAGYWTTASGDGTKIIDTDNHFVASIEGYTGAGKIWKRTSATNLYARWTANTYTVTLKPNGGSGSNQTVTATYDATMPSTTTASAAITKPAKTGYTFTGFWDSSTNGSGTKYYNADLSSARTWNKASTSNLWAQWSANTYRVTLDVDEENHGTIAGTTPYQDVTYDGSTTTVPNRPTAAQGYAFMGYYTDQGGEGLKVINADGTWIASVSGYTDGSKNWKHASDVTLYAYYKKAEITALTLDNAIVETNGTVGVTPTVSPTPTGDTKLCFYVFHSNDNPLDPQPSISWNGTKATFNAGAVSGTYKIGVALRTGTECGGGTLLDSTTVSYQVAGLHTVTVQYKCGDVTIKASTTTTGRPLNWSDEITPPVIFGYTFSSWTAGDGVTISTDGTNPIEGSTTTTARIYIKAMYDGKLTANYTQDNIIYFKNTLGWDNVYVNLMSGSYWNSDKGSGNSNTYYSRNNQMSLVPGTTDIYSYNFGATSTSVYVSFTSKSQISDNFWAANSDPVKVVYPTRPNDDGSEQTGYGFSVGTPMFVPTAGQTAVDKNAINGGRAKYYNKGYWRKYDPVEGQTGYTLKIYNQTDGTSSRKELKSIKFTDSDVNGQLFKAVANLEAGQGYGVKFMRDNDLMYTNITGDLKRTGYVVTAESNPDNYKAIWIKATAAGDYTFAITINGNGKLCIQADFPVAIGDYRVIYTDNDTWSQGTHTAQSWIHPSRIITQEAGAIDTISFFVSKGHAPQFRIQQATAINEATGAVTWGTNVTSWTSCNDVTASGVYNFIFTQDGDGGISFTKKEAYTGNYYIRTDCSGASKWDNYRDNPDHLMTYSEYSIDHGGYSHYFCHWVEASDEARRNLKFVIANDYSPCISDTLTREPESGTWEHIDDFMYNDGRLKRNANVRFMWNRSTNMISRAYLDPAKGDDNFLVLASADSKIANESEVVQTSVVFSDNENWIYEANVKAKANAQIKLVATWGDDPYIIQYFKGSADETETLITGDNKDTNWYDIRLIYDYKTNRLIAALLPSGNIDDPKPINADVMFIREHQGDISQVTFTDDGALTDIKIAYGVMRFNKWTLNNKEKTGSHDPLDDPKSYYERALYFISFPFEVKLSEVFGFGTYAQDWIIEYYDGAERARTGWWEGQPGFWRYVWDRKNYVLQPNVGYLLELELGNFGTESGFWNNDNERLELFFPSSGNLGSITNTTVNCSIPEHACTIDRHATEGLPDTGDPRTSYNRTIFDSHWNVMPVPTYVNATPNAWNNTTWTAKIGPKFLYTWNMDDNTLTATSGAGYRYHAMHAYMVQYGGNVRWVTSGTGPAPIVARRTYAEKPSEVEFRLEIQQNEKMVDQTFITLSNDEEVSADFQFGEDMSKEFNTRNANIFTKIGNTFAAGNTMPMSETTTIVPVGVSVKKAGDYTFSIPSGTNGVGITLIDEETGVRTSLSALDYTVDLSAGDYTERFWLEISPIKTTPTGLEEPTSDSSLKGREVRKVMIDQQMYIIKDGKIYDATGRRID